MSAILGNGGGGLFRAYSGCCFPECTLHHNRFFHLETRPYLPLWFDIGLLATFAWTGFFLGIVSLRIMHILVENVAGKFWVGCLH